MRQQIKDASFTQFKDFLENVRKYSVKIGELALQHVGEKYKYLVNVLDFFAEYFFFDVYFLSEECFISGVDFI